MVVVSSVDKVGSMGDLKYAIGKYYQNGATMVGNIVVPMKWIYYIGLTDIASGTGGLCSGQSTPYGISFPYASGNENTSIPTVTCISGVSGIWFSLGKGG